MKKILLAASMTFITTSAFAVDNTILQVTGNLTNAACSADLGNGGTIDYGYIRLGELSATANNTIGKKQIPVTINCTAPTKVGFTITDNRSDSNAQLPVDMGEYSAITYNYFTYGVGTTSEGVKIGNYSMWMTDITADSSTAIGIVHNNDWSSSKWDQSNIPRSDTFSTTSFAKPGTTTPIAVSIVSFNLVTNLAIRDTATLAITDDTELDGQNTMTLVYL